MPLPVNDKQLASIRAHAENDHPFECCGFITVDEGEVVRCENMASDRTKHFLIPHQILEAAERRHGILAIYHSHINAGDSASAEDMQYTSFLPGRLYIVVSVMAGVAKEPAVYARESDKLRRLYAYPSAHRL